MLVTFRFETFVKILAVIGIAGALGVLFFTAQAATGSAPAVPARRPTSQLSQLHRDAVEHRVHGTGGARLNLRSCAGTDCRRLDALPEGGMLRVECWVPGRAGDTEGKWLRGKRGDTTVYAAARYLRTTATTTVQKCQPPAAERTARG